MVRRYPPEDDLFGGVGLHTLTRAGDPETSRFAAARIAPQLRGKRAEVYAFFQQVIRATELDVENYFDDHRASYRSRVNELAKKGLLRDTGEQAVQNGTKRIIWELVPRVQED